MDFGAELEKIKREEQAKEAKLKAKREQEAANSAAERAIRDAQNQVKRLHQEEAELTKKIDKLRGEVTIHNIRRDALNAQLAASRKELKELQAKEESLASEVQEIRSSYCKAVQEASDECDVWALLTRPSLEALPCTTIANPPEPEEEHGAVEERLKSAIERKEKAIAERERLKTETDKGDDFIRNIFQKRNKRFFSSKTEIEAPENEPIKFSTSPAAQKTIKPILNKNANTENIPWYQPYSVIFSVAVFMLYFCVFREENDVDQEFTKTLYERIKGLEKEQLLLSYKFNKEQGKSVTEIEARLKELELQEKKPEMVV